jgi:hypothetical protein
MKKFNTTNWFAIALIYIAFFGLIGVTIWITKSAMPLLGLVFMPSVNDKVNDKEYID